GAPSPELHTLSLHDALPILAGLRLKGHEPAGKRVLLLGAGGAAGAIAYALLEAGVASLVIANRTRAKAEAVIDRLRPDFPDADRSEEHTSELQSRENLVCRL